MRDSLRCAVYLIVNFHGTLHEDTLALTESHYFSRLSGANNYSYHKRRLTPAPVVSGYAARDHQRLE